MFLNRIYMLVPSRHQAEEVVRDLMLERINRQHIHTVAKPGIDIEGLPEATVKQRSNFIARLESWIWDINLLFFFSALLLLFFSLWASEWLMAVGSIIVIVVTLVLGYLFARQVHQAHIDDFDVCLRHGEILLLVDVPRWRVTSLERAIRRKHPEVDLGGVGWAIDAIGI